MAKTVDYRLYVTLETALTRRLINAWRKDSAPLYERIAVLCNERQWDKARLLVTDLDMTEVGQRNREWIKFLLLSTAVFGAGIVAKTKPSFVGVGSFELLLTQVTNNFCQYLELNATQQIQQDALQLIAEDEAAAKPPPALTFKWEEAEHSRDKEGKFTETVGLHPDDTVTLLHGTSAINADAIMMGGFKPGNPAALAATLEKHYNLPEGSVLNHVAFEFAKGRKDLDRVHFTADEKVAQAYQVPEVLQDGLKAVHMLLHPQEDVTKDWHVAQQAFVDRESQVWAKPAMLAVTMPFEAVGNHGFGKKLTVEEYRALSVRFGWDATTFNNVSIPIAALQTAKIARKKWDESQHPRGPGGKFSYSPNTDAPEGGEWDMTGIDPDAMVGPDPIWRQQHQELVKNALQSWVGSPSSFRIHAQDALEGAAQPKSGSGKHMRAQAEALLWEINHNAKAIDIPLYRGSGQAGDAAGTVYSWSESKEVAERFAKLYGGEVETLPAGTAKGLRLRDYTGDAFGEKQWLVHAGVDARVKKADPVSGRYVTPFVSFDKHGEDKLQLIASLNSSRLATWGFTAECDMRGISRYKLTNVMDGRTSKFCAFINGKEFDVEDARKKVVECLNVQDPNDLKTVQPWPKQTLEAMEAFEEMSEEELRDAGLMIPPFHPRCRTLCKLIGAKDKGPGPAMPEPEPPPATTITMQTLQELGLADATQEQVDHWNAYVGVSPVEILGDLSGKAPQEILSKELGTRPITFQANGDIGLNAKGIMGDVRYAVGTVLDPYTGTYYLSKAELMAGNVVSEQKFLRRLFTALITTGEKTAAESLVVQVAGDVVTYVKLGFLPDPGEWQSIRLHMMEVLEAPEGAALLATLPKDQQLLITHLLNDNDEHALGALVDLKIQVKGKSVGEWLLHNVTGEFSLDLTDDLAVTQAKAYLT
jgi:hypothetical protein